MSDTTNDVKTDESLLQQKLELETEKLRAEIKEINNRNADLIKSWYKKPIWIAALSPIIVGLLTLIVVLSTGFLQAQYALNRLHEDNYKKEKKDKDAEIVTVRNQLDSLQYNRDSLYSISAILDSTVRKLARIKDTVISEKISDIEKINILFKEKQNDTRIINDLRLALNIAQKKIVNQTKENIKIARLIQSLVSLKPNPEIVTDEEIEAWVNEKRKEDSSKVNSNK